WKYYGDFCERIAMVQQLQQDESLPFRMRCLLKDVLDNRAEKWRKKFAASKEGPTSLAELHQQAQLEEQQQHYHHYSQQQLHGAAGGGGGGAGLLRGKGAAAADEGGWELASGRRGAGISSAKAMEKLLGAAVSEVKELGQSLDLATALRMMQQLNPPPAAHKDIFDEWLRYSIEGLTADKETVNRQRAILFRFLVHLCLKKIMQADALKACLVEFMTGEGQHHGTDDDDEPLETPYTDMKIDVPRLPEFMKEMLHVIESGILLRYVVTGIGSRRNEALCFRKVPSAAQQDEVRGVGEGAALASREESRTSEVREDDAARGSALGAAVKDKSENNEEDSFQGEVLTRQLAAAKDAQVSAAAAQELAEAAQQAAGRGDIAAAQEFADAAAAAAMRAQAFASAARAAAQQTSKTQVGLDSTVSQCSACDAPAENSAAVDAETPSRSVICNFSGETAAAADQEAASQALLEQEVAAALSEAASKEACDSAPACTVSLSELLAAELASAGSGCGDAGDGQQAVENVSAAVPSEVAAQVELALERAVLHEDEAEAASLRAQEKETSILEIAAAAQQAVERFEEASKAVESAKKTSGAQTAAKEKEASEAAAEYERLAAAAEAVSGEVNEEAGTALAHAVAAQQLRQAVNEALVAEAAAADPASQQEQQQGVVPYMLLAPKHFRISDPARETVLKIYFHNNYGLFALFNETAKSSGSAPIRIGINGMGRIGRLVFRIAMSRPDVMSLYRPCCLCGLFVVGGPCQTVTHINCSMEPAYIAYMLKYDSVHGRFEGDVQPTENGLLVNNREITLSNKREPAEIPWAERGADYICESTGAFCTSDLALKHIERPGGGKHVVISAPAKDEATPTLVVGVNAEQDYDSNMQVVSCASCTTNGLAPLVKVIDENFGLVEGLMTTVHAATGTQKVVDGSSKKDWRGGRAAGGNIIPSSTGAAKAVARCLPNMKGKLTGMAFRVPTLDVSVVDLTCRLQRSTTYDEIKAAVKKAADTYMRGIIGYTEEPVVSQDIVGAQCSTVFDATAGIMLNPNFVKLVSWYDNEYAYSARLVDLIAIMAAKDGVVPPGSGLDRKPF
ncbi:UNVERIFIED_CONTAM: hypothetical protein H355_009088, partial [Colinus virginianus]